MKNNSNILIIRKIIILKFMIIQLVIMQIIWLYWKIKNKILNFILTKMI